MRRAAQLPLLAALAVADLIAQVQLPASLRLAGPIDDLRSSLGDDIYNYPFGKGFGAGPIHGWIAVEFSPPVGRVAKFRLRWQTVGDEPFIAFATGAFFQAKAVANFDSGVQISQGELNLDTGQIRNLEIHAVFQNLLVHKTSRNNRFPLQSRGGDFTVLFGDYPELEFPFPIPFSERPKTFMESRFILSSEKRITGFEFRGATFIPITVVPNVALMPTYSFGRRGNTVIPGADGCLPGTTPPEQCLTDARFPDGLPSPDDAFLNPTLILVSEELQEIAGPRAIPPVRPGGGTTGASAAALAGRVYVFGGFDGQTAVRRASLYEPSRNEWSSLPEMPRAAWHACAAEVGGKLYVMGGRESAEGPPVATVQVFDPAAGWSAVPALPAPVVNAACAGVDGRVYVFGGWTPGGMGANTISDGAWAYDPSSGQWTSLVRMPATLAGAAAAIVGREIYILNGTQDGSSATNRVLVFTPSSGAWREGPRSVRGVYGASAAYLNARLFLAGGRLAVDGPLDVGTVHYQSQSMQVLVQGREWFASLDPPLPATDMASAVTGQTWYLIGGDTAPGGAPRAPTDVVQAFTAAQGWVISDTHPVYTSDGVRNAAGLGVGPTELAPGASASVLGFHLANDTRRAPPVRFNGRVFTTDLPEELAGVRVTVDGVAAGIVSVAPERIDFQVPFTIQAGVGARLVRFQVSRAGAAVEAPAVLVPIVEAAPGLFTYTHGETRALAHLDLSAAVAYNADGRLNYGSQPAYRGEAITLVATGLGDVGPRPEPLQRAPREIVPVALRTPEVLIDGKPAVVESVRLAPGEAGIYEIRVRIPADSRTGFRVPVRIRSGEIQSNRAIIVIE